MFSLPSLPLPLPDYTKDRPTEDALEQRNAVIVIGRRLGLELSTPSEVVATARTIAKWAQTSGLPLAYIHMGTMGNWSFEDDDSDGETSPALIGLVTAVVGDGAPTAISREALDASLSKRIPAEMWTDLERQGVVFSRDEDDNEEPPAVYLAPSGWSWALLHETASLDDGRIASASVDDTRVGKRLDTPQMAERLGARSELFLSVRYA